MKFVTKKYISLIKIAMLILNIAIVISERAGSSENSKENNTLNLKSRSSSLSLSEMKTMEMVNRANTEIKATTQAKIAKIKAELEGLDKTKKLLKAGIKEKLFELNKVLKSNKTNEINNKQLIKHTKTIQNGIKLLLKIEKKAEKKVSKDSKKLEKIGKVLDAHTRLLSNFETKKQKVNKIILKKTAALEDGILNKKLSPVEKYNLVRNIDNKTKTLTKINKVEKIIKAKNEHLIKVKNSIQDSIDANKKAFKSAFTNIFNKINVTLKNEKIETDHLAKNLLVTKKASEPNKLEKDLLKKDSHSPSSTSPIPTTTANNTASNLASTSSHSISLSNKDFTPITTPVKINKNSTSIKIGDTSKAKKLEKSRKKKEKVSIDKVKTDIVKVVKKQIPASKIAETDNKTKNSDAGSINQAFVINKDIDKIRRKVLKTINESSELVNRSGLKKNIHSLITDQEQLRHLINKSLSSEVEANRDVTSRSIKILRSYHIKEKLLNKKEKELKDELELYKSAEILNLNSLKLTGLLINLKHLNDDYAGKVPKKPEDKSIKAVLAKDKNPTLKKAIEKIFKKRDEILKKHPRLSADALGDIDSNTELLQFLETQTATAKNNYSNSLEMSAQNKLLENEKNSLLKKYSSLNEELKRKEKESSEKMTNLITQVDNNKFVMGQLESHIKQLERLDIDEKSFIKGLITQINTIKGDNKKYFTAILNKLNDENKSLAKKIDLEKNIVEKLIKQNSQIKTQTQEVIENAENKFLSLLQIKEKEKKTLINEINKEKTEINSLASDKNTYKANAEKALIEAESKFLSLLQIKEKEHKNLTQAKRALVTYKRAYKEEKLDLADKDNQIKKVNSQIAELERSLVEEKALVEERDKKLESIQEDRESFIVTDQKKHSELNAKISKLENDYRELKRNYSETKDRLTQVETGNFKIKKRDTTKITKDEDQVTETNMKKKFGTKQKSK